jgi:hypothetical protein
LIPFHTEHCDFDLVAYHQGLTHFSREN